MAVAVERRPVHWTTSTSPEPFAAWLIAGRQSTTVYVNRRVATTPWHGAVISAWVEIHKHGPGAVLPASALGIRLV